jgi:hypothetical protein
MATIPKYSRQVSPQALPDVKYTQAGGGESAAAFKGVSALATGLDQYQEKQDTDTVVQALNSAKLDAMEFYNGENGLFAQKGNNATGTMDKAKKFNDDTITKYTSFMQNDRQKNAFLKHYSQTAGVFLSDAMTHERSESAKAFQQNIANTREIAKQRGVANYNSMPTLDDAINDITTSVGLEGSRNGYSADVVKSNKDKEVTDTVRQAFNQAMDLQDYTSAGKIVEAYKDKVNPSVFGKMKAAYQKVQDKIFEFKTADDIIKQSTLPDGTVDRAKANQLIDASFGVDAKKVDPEKHETVSRLVDARILDINRAKTENDKRYKESLAEQINAAESASEANEIIENSNLTPAQKKALHKSSKTKYKTLSGSPTAEQLFFSKYEKSGLYSDLKKIKEYEAKVASGEEIDEKDQAKYNVVSERLQSYWIFSSGGAYGEKAQENAEQSAQSQEKQAAWYSQQFESIKASNPGATDEEIYQYLTEQIKQAGG